MAATADSTRRLPKKTIDLLKSGQSTGIQITREEFDSAVSMLEEAGYPIEVNRDTAWAQFSVFRESYEFVAYQLCEALDAVHAPWTGPRHKETIVIAPTSAVEILKTQLDTDPSTSLDPTLPDSTSLNPTPPDSKSRAVSPDE
jgi:hypothetical protein